MLRRLMLARASGGGWTPAELNPFAWMDDSTDTSSDDYPGLRYWGNRGVGIAHFRAVNGPDVTPNGLAGRRVMSFNGSQRLYADETGRYSSNQPAIWYAAVYRSTGTGNSCIIGASIGGNFASHRASLFSSRATEGNSGKPSVGGRRLDNDAFSESQHPSVVSEWAILVGLINYQERTVSLSVNGGPRQTTINAFSGSGNSAATEGRGLTIGAVYLGNLVDHLTGGIAEVLTDASVLSEGDEARLTGYLAHKWGLAQNLPSGHAYKAAPPTL